MALYNEPPKIVYPMGSGMNQGIPPSELPQDQSVLVENFFTQGRRAIRRGGIRRVTSVAYAEQLNSFFPYKKKTGQWTLIVGATTTFGKLTGTAIVAIPITGGLALIPLDIPFVFIQYNDIVYAVRKGDGRLFRLTTDLIELAGIPAPTTATVLAETAGGALAAGTYSAVQTFFNSATGAESNPSPRSNIVTAVGGGAGGGIMFHTSIEVSSTPQVDQVRLYRTLLNQVNEYFYVATINNGVTVHTEEVLPENMGDPVRFDNYMPPTTLRWLAQWNERGWGTDGTYVFFTNLFTMEGWSAAQPEDGLAFNTDDGHEIRVLFPFGDRLVVGKTNKVHFLIGTDRNTFRALVLSDRHGCMSGHSMKAAEGYLFWFGSGKNFYRSDGNNTVGIGDIKIRTILDNLPDSLQEQITAAIFPQYSQYVASIPQVGNTHNRLVVVYNYRNDSWDTYRHPADAPQYLEEFFDTNYGRSLYGTQYDGHIYHLYDRTLTNDFGTPITAKILTRQEDGGTLFSKRLRRIHILCNSAAADVALKAYRDGQAVPSVSRSVSLSGDGWKPYNLAAEPAGTVQLGLEYSGATAIELEALGMELETVERYVGQPR